MAAVSASCSGDKSDNEESAGGFRSYGDCALPSLRLRPGVTAAPVSGRVDRSVFMGRCGRLGSRAGLTVSFSVDVMRLVAMVGPVPAGGGTGCDGWIMLLPPKVARGIAGFDRG